MTRIMALALALAVSTVGTAFAEDLDFTLINGSNSDVVAFHVSHAGTGSWEENLIAGGFLPSGNELGIQIADGRSTCVYDILTEFADGQKLEDYGLDLCELGSYTLQ
jgi:hypothetical protein